MAHYDRVRHQRVEALGNALLRMMKKRGWKERIDRQRVLMVWARLVGELNAGHAKALRVEGRILMVKTDSPVWSHTLTMMKPDLLKRLRAAVPDTEVRDIRFLCGDESSAPTIVERSRRWRKAPPRP